MTRPFDPARYPDTVVPRDPLAVADRPAARLAARLLQDMDAVTDQVVATIRQKLSRYTTGEVPRDDLWWSVRANNEVLMRIIAEDRELKPDEMEIRSGLGARRARQQLAVTTLIQAFQVGYIETWRIFTAAAKAEGEEAVNDLVEVAGHFWATMHLVSSGVAEAHHEVSREQGSEVRRRALSFLDMLHGLPSNTAAARDDAHALGFDPDGHMLAAVRRPRPDDDPLRYRDAGQVLIERPDAVVLLTNTDGGEESHFDAEVGPIGIGLARPGLTGALESIRDATQAYDAARKLNRPVMRFRQDWFACVMASQLPRLHPLVTDAVAALEADDFTAETIQAYLDHDGRLGPTGEAIHVHANTVSYRLERFAERTGIDPRTNDGHVHVLLAI
ncbi:MAG TPA: helix-turn-helix domain-containing protein, partial [Euzebya sp.]|nr:helix-turn-helix domain-containing protein [Euzebya sp.]